MDAPRSPLLKVLIALTILGLLAAGVAAWILLSPVSREIALREARERGLELDCETIDVRLGRAELGTCRFTLVGVTVVRGTIRSATAKLDGMHPTSIEAEDVDVRIHGAAPDVAVQLARWSQAHPRAFRTPTTAKGVAVQWSAAEGGIPWLVVTEGTVAPVPKGGAFIAQSATVADVKVGKVGATWHADGDQKTGSVALGFGTDELAKAPVTVQLNHGAAPPTAEVTLRPTLASKLALPLGVALPIDAVTLSGSASLVFEGASAEGPVRGNLQVLAKGFIPPHPPELDGIVFGDTTTFRSRFEIDPSRTLVTLTETTVTAGAFKLAGGGKLARKADHTSVSLALRGSIPCTALAQSAAVSRLGTFVGRIVGAAARQAMQGSVGVTVKITADTRDLASAKIDQSIGIGCGLRPISIDLPPLPSGLPPLPTAFPTLPRDLPLPIPLPTPPRGE